MAKVSRELLKDLVKECLVEILSEGLSSTSSAPSQITELKSQKKKPTARRPVAADLISYNQKSDRSARVEKNLNSRIKAASGGDSIMESILRDTAKNTLPSMMAADQKDSQGMAQRVAQGDAATKAMVNADPMDIFEGAGNWAALAFAGSEKN